MNASDSPRLTRGFDCPSLPTTTGESNSLMPHQTKVHFHLREGGRALRDVSDGFEPNSSLIMVEISQVEIKQDSIESTLCSTLIKAQLNLS